jgi:hypothetical protein
MKKLSLGIASLFIGISKLLANGGAWQAGVPGTGSASASDKTRKTDVAIEDEKLKIDLHPEYASVEVRYRMQNTGPKTEQEFFFPVERWGKNPDADTDTKSADVDQYQITIDEKNCHRRTYRDRNRKQVRQRPGRSGGKMFPRSSHGRNRLSLSTETKHAT